MLLASARYADNDAIAAAANATQYRTEHRVTRGSAILPVRTTRTNWREIRGRRARACDTNAAAAADDDLCAQLAGRPPPRQRIGGGDAAAATLARPRYRAGRAVAMGHDGEMTMGDGVRRNFLRETQPLR